MSSVDVVFLASGGVIPADHSYLLFSAVANLVPSLHAATAPPDQPESGTEACSAVGICPISGQLVGGRSLRLGNQSCLVIRAPFTSVQRLISLAGAVLELSPERVTLGLPTLRPLRPASRLRSRIVIIKGPNTPDEFRNAVKNQLARLGIDGEPALLLRRRSRSFEGRSDLASARLEPFVRRTITIKGVEVPGDAVEVSDLDAESSLLLQEKGIGGRRHFGAGIFVPARA